MSYEVHYIDEAGHKRVEFIDAENDSAAYDKARLYYGTTAEVLVSRF